MAHAGNVQRREARCMFSLLDMIVAVAVPLGCCWAMVAGVRAAVRNRAEWDRSGQR
jgi:hypothetical protein